MDTTAADRIRPLDPPHKGLRNALGVLSLAAGRTEFADDASVAELQELGRQVWILLRDHARLEDVYIFDRLERAVPGATAQVRAEHADLDDMVDRLEAHLATFRGDSSNDEGHEFVLALSDFQARYVEHLRLEELLIEPLLIEHVSDEEFAADQQAIMAESPFETLLLWFRYIVPARRVADTRPIMAGFVANAPAEAVEPVRALLREVLPAETFDAIFTGLPEA